MGSAIGFLKNLGVEKRVVRLQLDSQQPATTIQLAAT
jgi:hypothetical protein